ncbi:MAG: hypothetical protein ABR507_08750 [Actinomycetota bacterium]|nr:hypothetical protein [Actinomycetota bacterium]
MDWKAWATFGLAATAALTGIMVVSQVAGFSRLDIPMLLGTIFIEDPDRARVVGSLIHIVNGQAFAVLYLLAFSSLGWSTWWLGAMFGLAHGLAASILIIPMMPGFHPRMASESQGRSLNHVLEPPGLMGLHYGTRTPVVVLFAHLIYGAILGATLGQR